MIHLPKIYRKTHVIALKVPISLGLALIRQRNTGFSLGLAGIEYFDMNNISKEEKDSFHLDLKYYFPQVLSSFDNSPKKDTLAICEQVYH